VFLASPLLVSVVRGPTPNQKSAQEIAPPPKPAEIEQRVMDERRGEFLSRALLRRGCRCRSSSHFRARLRGRHHALLEASEPARDEEVLERLTDRYVELW
jgi:hypothetical protein